MAWKTVKEAGNLLLGFDIDKAFQSLVDSGAIERVATEMGLKQKADVSKTTNKVR